MLMPTTAPFLPLERGLEQLVDSLLTRPEQIMLAGPPGSGKSTLAATIAARLAERGQPCACLCADPGSPVFGLPAAINLGHWQDNGWQLQASEALCSLDAARFRLPLVALIAKLANKTDRQQPLLVDMPGVVRGVAGAELLTALVDALAPDRLVLLDAPPSKLFEQECACLSIPQLRLISAEAASSPTQATRRAQRTALWQEYLRNAEECTLPLSQLALLGTPPPLSKPESWRGHLIGLHDNQHTLAMGEVLALETDGLRLRCPPYSGIPNRLSIRDAVHLPGGALITRQPLRPAAKPPPSLVLPADVKRPLDGPQVRTGEAMAELVNGVFDDPLLLVQLKQSRRCLLFDLGDTARLPLRYANRTSDVFITHAHIDHIGGFIGLLRARLGAPSLCRLWGPPGLGEHIAGMLSGVLWDRIGDDGPCFEVAELHGERLVRCRMKAGYPQPVILDEQPVSDGLILHDSRFKIRAVQLDHRTPVLAYAFEPIVRRNVCQQRLAQMGWRAGPWLAELLLADLQGECDKLITLPDGSRQPAAQLSGQLLHSQPGDKLVYATDLADTADNRQRLQTLAAGAHTLFCEASFAQSEAERAFAHGHLTTRACGEIAAGAGVRQLAPFHFSRRYEPDAAPLYEEIASAFTRVFRSYE